MYFSVLRAKFPLNASLITALSSSQRIYGTFIGNYFTFFRDFFFVFFRDFFLMRTRGRSKEENSRPRDTSEASEVKYSIAACCLNRMLFGIRGNEESSPLSFLSLSLSFARSFFSRIPIPRIC